MEDNTAVRHDVLGENLPQQLGFNGPHQNQPMIINANIYRLHLIRLSLTYVRWFPPWARSLLEFGLLIQAFLLLGLLVYVQRTLANVPAKCLDHVKLNWPRDGVLRVEMITSPEEIAGLASTPWNGSFLFYDDGQLYSSSCEDSNKLSLSLDDDDYEDDETADYADSGMMSRDPESFIKSSLPPVTVAKIIAKIRDNKYYYHVPIKKISPYLGPEELRDNSYVPTKTISQVLVNSHGLAESHGPAKGNWTKHLDRSGSTDRLHCVDQTADGTNLTINSNAEFFEPDPFDLTDKGGVMVSPDSVDNDVCAFCQWLASWMENMFGLGLVDSPVRVHPLLIMEFEYSRELKFLLWTAAMREKYDVPVTTVQLDLHDNTCIDGSFNKALFDHVVGYEYMMLASFKALISAEENYTSGDEERRFGYVHNLLTGAHHKLDLTITTTKCSSVLVALYFMLVFTVSISVLVRYIKQHLSTCFVNLMDLLEMNAAAIYPIVPLLIGMIALSETSDRMTSFFNDPVTAFYTATIVCMADMFDSLCNSSSVGKRHWPRFFYLYHAAFYAYHHRFNGECAGLALLTSCSFIQHSMIYFFHRYELPMILQQHQDGAVFHDNVQGPGDENVVNPEAPRTPPVVAGGSTAGPASAGILPSSMGTQQSGLVDAHPSSVPNGHIQAETTEHVPPPRNTTNDLATTGSDTNDRGWSMNSLLTGPLAALMPRTAAVLAWMRSSQLDAHAPETADTSRPRLGGNYPYRNQHFNRHRLHRMRENDGGLAS